MVEMRRKKAFKDFCEIMKTLSKNEQEEKLWELLEIMQGCLYQTVGRRKTEGLRFKYSIRGGETFIDRKEKSITKSTVLVAFQRALEIQNSEECVGGSKKFATFGASYLYPVFIRIGFTQKEHE